MSEKTSSTGAPAGAEAPPAVPARWSAGRKTEVVLRLLRGEPVDMVARETQVPAHELEAWRRVFLTTGTHGLKKQGDPEAREVRRLQAKLGEVMMRLELAEDLLEKRGYGTSGGGMGDERHAQSHDGPALPAHAGVCRLSGAAVDGVYRGRADDGSSRVVGGQAGPEDAGVRRDARGGHSGRAGGHAVPWRGPPQGAGAPAPAGPSGGP